jgi:hypothetical protein
MPRKLYSIVVCWQGICIKVEGAKMDTKQKQIVTFGIRLKRANSIKLTSFAVVKNAAGDTLRMKPAKICKCKFNLWILVLFLLETLLKKMKFSSLHGRKPERTN